MQIRMDQIAKILCGSEAPSAETLFVHPPERNIPSSLHSSTAERILPSSGKALCAPMFSRRDPEKLHDFFVLAGLERMHLRAQNILHDIIQSGMKQAFLIRLFDAAGVRSNRLPFRELLERVRNKYPAILIENELETLLWGESGLLPPRTSGNEPEESRKKTEELWNRWWNLRKDAAPPVVWNRRGVRPLNSPERRIAGIILLLNRHGFNPLPRWLRQLKESEPETFCRDLIGELVLNDPFWDFHTTFHSRRLETGAAVIGTARARELATDVILPSLRAAACSEKDPEAMNRVDSAFRALPCTQKNGVFRSALQLWFEDPPSAEKLFRDAASRQGVLHLHGNCCSNPHCSCSECPVRRVLLPAIS